MSAPGMDLRAVIKDNEPWFVATDVCKAVALSNTTMALRTLDAYEQALSSIEGIHRGGFGVNLVNESGLYSLILKSRKPEARAFKKRVTSVVLPAIRKDGGYIKGPSLFATGVNVKSDSSLSSRHLVSG